MTTSLRLALLATTLAACARPAPPVRFADAPPVAAVDDRRHTPVAPAARDFARLRYHVDGSVTRRLTRALALPRPQRALGVNALDEVPDSTWFTNRIGVRDLAPDEVRRGPAVVGSPEPHRPWTIHSSKVGGASIGFVIRDARGERFVLKFDPPGFPEVETAADAIAGRLLWAVGYHVPEDHVVYLRREDLILAPGATRTDGFGNRRPLTAAEVDRQLARVAHEPDGRIRGLASRLLDGTWLGGHPGEGVRADDPNDRIPHELRRDLRGARAVFAWLDHLDVKEDNTLDMWVADPADPGRRYVKHYLIDFGKALGAMALLERDHRRGYVYAFDPGDLLGSLLTAGLRERPWADRPDPGLRGVGLWTARGFDPGRWKPHTAAYVPFHTADRRDQLWAARLVMRFTRAQLEAAVDAGRLSDPRAAAYLTDVLVARQRALGRYWFSRTAPLDRFTVAPRAGGIALCFDDLLLTYQLAPVRRTTRYAIHTTDRAGRALAPASGPLAPGPDGRTCTARLPLAPDGDGYTIVHVRTRRRGFDQTTQVHLARTGGTVRVRGIWRP